MQGPSAVNISNTKRGARILVGLVAVAAGAILLTGASSALAVTLEFLLFLAGLDLIAPARPATAFCTRRPVTCRQP